MISHLRRAAIFIVLLCWSASHADAQVRRTEVEAFGGWAGFVDDATIHHTAAGGAARFYLTPRVAVGPEFAYMWGPDDDRDLLLTGNLTFDFLPTSGTGARRVSPFVVVGGGWYQFRDRFGTEEFTASDPAFTVGGGFRTWVTDDIYIAPEARLGWELHIRTGVAVGLRLGD